VAGVDPFPRRPEEGPEGAARRGGGGASGEDRPRRVADGRAPRIQPRRRGADDRPPYVFDCPEDRLVWDVGHQAYAHKILTGRGRSLRRAADLGRHLRFPRICESPYDAFGTAHSGTSISAALGLATAGTSTGGRTASSRSSGTGRSPTGWPSRG
jgi:hypothetical protein